jgi:hypothetical protein
VTAANRADEPQALVAHKDSEDSDRGTGTHSEYRTDALWEAVYRNKCDEYTKDSDDN